MAHIFIFICNVCQTYLHQETKLNDYETIIAADVVDPEHLKETFEDVGGLEKTIQLLTEEVVLPFTRPELFNQQSELLQPPKGSKLSSKSFLPQ